jgi:hypothetical protein
VADADPSSAQHSSDSLARQTWTVLRHLAVSLTSRAPRAALLVPEVPTVGPDVVGDDWRQVARRALEVTSCWWGGPGALLVPVSGHGVAEVFRRLLRAYDPDVVLAYQPTTTALRRSDGTRFQEWVAANPVVAAHVASGGDAPEVPLARDWAHEVLQDLHDHVVSAAAFEVAEMHYVHSGSQTRPPLTHIAHVVSREISLSAGSSLTGVMRYLGQRDLPQLGDPVSVLDVGALAPDVGLLVHQRAGTIAYDLGADGTPVESSAVKVTVVAVPADAGAQAWQLAFMDHVDSNVLWATSFETSPAARALHGLQRLYRGVSRLPWTLVVGDSLADFCLASALQVIYGTTVAAWAPTHLVSGSDPDATPALVEWVETRSGLQSVRVTSMTLQPAERESVATQLAAIPRGTEPPTLLGSWGPIRTASREAILALPPGRQFIAPPDTVDQRRTVPFDGTVALEQLQPLVPDIARRVGGDLDWVSDAIVENCRPCPRPATAAAVSMIADPGAVLGEAAPGVRAGRDGASWAAIDERAAMPESLPVEHRLQRVRVIEPDAETLVTVLAANAGLIGEASNAGLLYAGSLELFGGLEPLAEALADPVVAAVLDAYLVPVKTAGAGVTLSAAQRRVLRLSDVRNAVAAATGTRIGVPETRALLDRLVARDVLRLGYVLKCPRCLFSAFYVLDAIGATFRCGRCLVENRLDAASWCNVPPHQPALFHELDELVYQALDQGMAGPVAALQQLHRATPLGGFRYGLPQVFRDRTTGTTVEVDFVTLCDGVLGVGEAKLNGKLGKNRVEADREAAKLRTLAKRLTADVVIFYSPPDKPWTDLSLAALTTAFPSGETPSALVL